MLHTELEANGFAVQVAASLPSSAASFEHPTLLVVRWKPDLDRTLASLTGVRLSVLALIERPSHLSSAAHHADDFMLHPFHPLEMRVRVQRLLDQFGKTETPPPMARPASVMEVGPLRLDPASARVWLAGRELVLTRREYDLLSVFMSRPDQVISRDHLLELAWGERFNGKARTVDQHIAQLRALLDDDVTQPRFIATRRGRGYVFLNGQDSMTNA